MSDEALPKLDRITELLADRALFGLDDAEQRELDKLLIDVEDFDSQSMERVAAAAQLATLGQIESLPEHLANQLATQGREALGASPTTHPQLEIVKPQTTLPRRELFAWLAAAASIAYAMFYVTEGSQSAAELRTELLALAKKDSSSLTQVAWGSGPDSAGKNATGEVVWHNGRQQGVMRFSGLPANDPNKLQYQLWIFDKNQDTSYPIDGGVFDIPDGSTDALIKIDAKIPVVDPTMFAITIEKPGGVVVSSRERLPLLAKVE